MRRVLLSDHAMRQIQERRLSAEAVIQSVEGPDEVLAQGVRFVAQTLMSENGKRYLLRVFYEDTGDSLTVVTVYKTSKISKYRGAQ